MRILHTNMLRGWGGQSNRILTEALGQHRAGHAVALAVPHESKLYQRAAEAGLEVWPHFQFKSPGVFWKFLPDVMRFRRHIREWKPDIIHTHGSQDTWVTVIAGKIAGDFPPIIRTKHNMFVWKKSVANKWLYNRITGYVSISSAIFAQVDSYPGLRGKPHAIIRSIPDTQRFEAPQQTMRGEITGLRDGMFLWGSTGRLRQEKAVDVLLKAFAMLRKKQPTAYLVIAGDGSELEALKALAAELGLDESCFQFLGFRKDVPAVLASLDGYVLASRSEGLGTAILEALAVGLPVVATNTGGIPDSVHHEESGLLAPVDDPAALSAAMERIMTDAALRARLSSGAKKIIHELFDEETLHRQTIEFYTKVCAPAS
ncbi:glycosyltransferase family 4 protein [soil metagenome]